MANTRGKKGKKAPEVNVGAEIFESLRELERLKGIPVEYMVDRLKQALLNAYRKDREESKNAPDGNVFVELSESGLYMYQNKSVVETVFDTTTQIHVDAARNIDPNIQVGDNMQVPIKVGSFGRIAAQTAKQVIIQGIREQENHSNYESFSSKNQEMLTGEVYRKEPNGDVIVRIGQGDDAYEALLRSTEQIPGESYVEGQTIRVYVLEVHGSNRGTSVRVSRTHPNLVRRLFELEAPEISEGLVEIRHIAREAGSRSKMAVHAANPDVDPVGACVGPKGGRVSAVVNELHGEKIDIVVWSEDPGEYVKAALAPADVLSVSLIPGTQKTCRVIVPDDQLSLAIGKEGQNARLAARLTGYKIDIKPASQAEPEQAETEQAE